MRESAPVRVGAGSGPGVNQTELEHRSSGLRSLRKNAGWYNRVSCVSYFGTYFETRDLAARRLGAARR